LRRAKGSPKETALRPSRIVTPLGFRVWVSGLKCEDGIKDDGKKQDENLGFIGIGRWPDNAIDPQD